MLPSLEALTLASRSSDFMVGKIFSEETVGAAGKRVSERNEERTLEGRLRGGGI